MTLSQIYNCINAGIYMYIYICMFVSSVVSLGSSRFAVAGVISLRSNCNIVVEFYTQSLVAPSMLDQLSDDQSVHGEQPTEAVDGDDDIRRFSAVFHCCSNLVVCRGAVAARVSARTA